MIPLLGYDVVVSIGDALSGAPSENGGTFTVSADRTNLRQADSGNARESRVVEALSKGVVYYVYIRAQNTAFDFQGNGDWSAVEKHICMSTSKSVSVSLSVFVSACI